MSAPGVRPSRSQLAAANWDHLGQLAAECTALGRRWDHAFTRACQEVKYPGGTEWHGEAATTAQYRAEKAAMQVRGGPVDALLAVGDVARRGQDRQEAAKRLVFDAIGEAEADGFVVGEDYSVSDTTSQYASEEQRTARELAARGHAKFIGLRVDHLLDSENEIAHFQRRAAEPLHGFSFDDDGGDGGAGQVPGAVAATPADALVMPADPRARAEFWKQLTPEQKGALYARDHSIGNLDGIPVDPADQRGRDWYNRRNLGEQLTAARVAGDDVAALAAQHPDWARGENIPGPNPPGAIFNDRVAYENWQARYDDAREQARYLPDLQATQLAAEVPGCYLLLLGTETGRPARAAIAVGNPDTADHISVTTPGLNTTVRGSTTTMADEATKLREEALFQLENAGRGSESVATVTWIGYEPPQIHRVDGLGGMAGGGWEISHDSVAKAGAVDLAGFYDGLAASHVGQPAHVTAIGHSYGSLTTGLALQQPGEHGIGDAIFYGSPGIEATTPAQLNLASGHVYALQAPDDPIRWVYDSKTITHGEPAAGPLLTAALSDDFVPNPATNPEFTRLATVGGSVPDGRILDGAAGHSQYPQLGDNGLPRITGYNLAAILAGLPDAAVRGK